MTNWKTTVSAYVTALALYLYQDPEALKLIPEPWRTYVYKTIGFLIFAGIIALGHTAKDNQPKP